MNTIISEDIESLLKADLPWEDFRGKTVLITGAYGMLASYLVYPLLRLNEKDPTFGVTVLAVGRSREKMQARFGEFMHEGSGLVPIYAGASHLEEACNLPPVIDYVIHAASPTNPRSYIEEPTSVIETNVTATLELLRLTEKKRTKSFLFISSGEVYGIINQAVIREEDGGIYKANEPRNVYGLSKRLGERLCQDMAAKSEMRIGIVRPSHTYGPTMSLQGDGRVFADFVGNVIKGQDIVMTSDGMASRAFIYLTDAAFGYFSVLLKGKSGQAYNVTNNDGIRTIRELAVYMATLAEPPVRAVFGEADKSYRENANRKASIRSTEKLESLGWLAAVSPEEGFRRCVLSFREKASIDG